MKKIYQFTLVLAFITNLALSQNTFPSTGNVGIGTTAPDGFQVNIPLTLENSRGMNNIRMGILGGSPRIIFDNTGFIPFEIDVSSGQFRIYNPGVVRLAINPDGNVGIGTTLPGSYKLAVAGKIAAAGEVRVFTYGYVGFPDYVFEPTYKLPLLEDTEAYIKENKHLPEVPSAKEIEKDGMSLNEMNVILLKKVEELTLYMIEMKKENDQMKSRLEVLEKKK